MEAHSVFIGSGNGLRFRLLFIKAQYGIMTVVAGTMNKPNTGPFFPAGHILRHPGQFTLRVFRGFLANQGLLLAGAVAYYTLLSVVPLFTFLLLILSHLMDERLVVDVLTAYLARVVPGETASIVDVVIRWPIVA